MDFALLIGADVGVSGTEPFEALSVTLVVDPFALVNARICVGDDSLTMPLAVIYLANIHTVFVALDRKVVLLLNPCKIYHIWHYRLVAQILLLFIFVQILFSHPFFHTFAV